MLFRVMAVPAAGRSVAILRRIPERCSSSSARTVAAGEGGLTMTAWERSMAWRAVARRRATKRRCMRSREVYQLSCQGQLHCRNGDGFETVCARFGIDAGVDAYGVGVSGEAADGDGTIAREVDWLAADWGEL